MLRHPPRNSMRLSSNICISSDPALSMQQCTQHANCFPSWQLIFSANHFTSQPDFCLSLTQHGEQNLPVQTLSKNLATVDVLRRFTITLLPVVLT